LNNSLPLTADDVGFAQNELDAVTDVLFIPNLMDKIVWITVIDSQDLLH
jgi:hypothetical protein